MGREWGGLTNFDFYIGKLLYKSMFKFTFKMYGHNQILFKECATVRSTVRNNRLDVLQGGISIVIS